MRARAADKVKNAGMKSLSIIGCLAVLLCYPVVNAAPHHQRNARPPSPRVTALAPDAINAAAPQGDLSDPALMVKVAILLDRKDFSPGEIGENGDGNLPKALAAFQAANNLPATGKINRETWNVLVSDDTPPLTSYTLTQEDVAGPFAERTATGLEQMAELPALSYKNAEEELAEKFHMSPALLRRLNPSTQFDRAGAQVIVTNVEPMALRDSSATVEAKKADKQAHARANVATIVVDKASGEVRAYDKDGKLLAFYPATVGSAEKPAPSGTFAVQRVAYNPDYHYDPKFAWKGVKTNKPLVVKPGPNNPVGLVWIDLTAPSYGIHGTPEPGKIGKTESHGCVRLTNWDALKLASMVHKGTVVKFDDHDSNTGGRAAD